jgi:membrane associated rhomboid family serine protease
MLLRRAVDERDPQELHQTLIDDRPPDESVTVPSPAVAREIHAESVREQRSAALKRLPFLLATMLVWGGLANWRVETLAFFLVGLAAFSTGRAVAEWWRLRNTDPVEAVMAVRRQEIEQSRHEQRMLSTTLAMTYGLMTAICVVWLFQIYVGGLKRSIDLAGLYKPAVRAGQWWRLLSSTYLHGSWLHLLGNLAALRAIGGTMETYELRLRVPLVYLLSALGGGIVSFFATPATAVGASGGIIGLCGYLLVLASRQPQVAPPWIRGWMLGVLGATAALGLFGFFFIDNAAHLGGALTGMLCAVAMIPAEGRPQVPGRERLLDALGWVSALILLAGAGFTVRCLIPR